MMCPPMLPSQARVKAAQALISKRPRKSSEEGADERNHSSRKRKACKSELRAADVLNLWQAARAASELQMATWQAAGDNAVRASDGSTRSSSSHDSCHSASSFDRKAMRINCNGLDGNDNGKVEQQAGDGPDTPETTNGISSICSDSVALDANERRLEINGQNYEALHGLLNAANQMVH
jgi:hypothetical protein